MRFGPELRRSRSDLAPARSAGLRRRRRRRDRAGFVFRMNANDVHNRQERTAIVIKARLNKIRAPENVSGPKAAIHTAAALIAGMALGVFAKWLDNLALDSTVWWRRGVEVLDLGNFFSEIAVWLLAALMIAVFSASAWRAALNVFVFFAGMCAAYHIYTVLFSGFDPAAYMMLWYGITLVSPLFAVLCWYARGTGTVSLLLDIGIFAVFWLSCFAIGIFYVDWRGILSTLVFAGAAAALYRNPKQLMLSAALGFLAALLLSPIWPNL